jgi:hypothetical protein
LSDPEDENEGSYLLENENGKGKGVEGKRRVKIKIKKQIIPCRG